MIKNLTICTDPRLNISRHLRLDISPDDQLSQQSVTIHLPSTHYFLNINPEIPPALMERQYKMFVTSGNQRLQALPAAPGQAADKRRPNFEARLTPGMNKIEVELIAALPRGTVKPLSGPDAELERVTVFVNLLKV